MTAAGGAVASLSEPLIGRVLVAGDLLPLARRLATAGHEVHLESRLSSALASTAWLRPDVVLVRIGGRGCDGELLVDRLHAVHPQVGVITVHDGATPEALVDILERGADDAVDLASPFVELAARVRSQIRRGRRRTLAPVQRFGPLTVDALTGRVTCRATELDLEPAQVLVLRLLVAAAGGVVPRETLVRDALGPDPAPHPEAVVRALGDRLAAVHGPRIRAVLGLGWCLTDDPVPTGGRAPGGDQEPARRQEPGAGGAGIPCSGADRPVPDAAAPLPVPATDVTDGSRRMAVP